MVTRRIRGHAPVQEPGLPSFWSVLGYLLCIVLSVAMIVGLMPGLLAGVLFAWIFLLAFCLVIGYSTRRLAVGLFPGRFLRCPVCSLVREIIEIDGTVR
jgi:hypothetical protein